jgi:anti-sigma regulatory factor (Ser/Thr protein kinase)
MIETTHRVKADKQAPRTSRSFLNDIKDELEPRFDDVAIVVSVLVSNAVRHGRDEITLRLVSTDDSIRVEVMDWGQGFSRDAPRGDGLGLNIVDRIASDWGVQLDGLCTVWVDIPRYV